MNLKTAIRVFLFIALSGLIGFSLIRFVGDELLASANKLGEKVPADFPVENVGVRSLSGAEVQGWIAIKPGSTAIVLLFHPIRADRLSMLGRAQFLYEAGYSVALVDLQAHGETEGEMITVGYLEKYDVQATVEYVRARFPEQKVAVIGSSLGGASALLASPLGVEAMVLESVYPTVEQAVENRIAMRAGVLKYALAPMLLAYLESTAGIERADLRPIEFISSVDCPILILAGDKDEHTPLEESKEMFRAASEPKHLVVFEGGAHEDFLKYDSEKYQREVLEFLSSSLK